MHSLVTLGVFTSFIYSFIEMILIIKGYDSYVNELGEISSDDKEMIPQKEQRFCE